MAKLTANQLRDHKQAEEILALPRDLGLDEIEFVLEHWQPGSHEKARGQAFFTPDHIAEIVAYMVPDQGRAVDLGAGIGRLTYRVRQSLKMDGHGYELTAVEINPDFIKVGQRLMPDVCWVEGDLYDQDLWKKLGRFDWFFSNPPFGSASKKNPGRKWLRYTGDLALMAMEVGMRVTGRTGGVAILPQAALPEQVSGYYSYQFKNPIGTMQNFKKDWPEIVFRTSPFDTIPTDDNGKWKPDSGFADASIKVEVVAVDWYEQAELVVDPTGQFVMGSILREAER